MIQRNAKEMDVQSGSTSLVEECHKSATDVWLSAQPPATRDLSWYNPAMDTVSARNDSSVGSLPSRIVDLADRADALIESEGKEAAGKIVLSSIEYRLVQKTAKTGSPLARRKSLSLLHYWSPSDAAVELSRALRYDPCPVVRHEAAYYLGTLKRSETVDALILALQNDPADIVRHEAAEALGDMGACDALPALSEAACTDRSDIVVRTAQIAMEQLAMRSPAK